MSVECAEAALALVEENLGTFPVKAVIYSHSHVDHFGGVKGIISEEDVQSGDVQVIAPEGFEKYAVSENIYAGTGMGRRASYQYGTLLDARQTDLKHLTNQIAPWSKEPKNKSDFAPLFESYWIKKQPFAFPFPFMIAQKSILSMS